MILNDRKGKLIQIAETLKISKERVGHLMHEYLDMQKLCATWVPRELTIDQKEQRIDDSEQCLKLFNRNQSEFLRRYVTMDETWLHHFTPESNRQSAEWTAYDEPNPKRGKTQQSAGKVMASVFWDAHEIYRIVSQKSLPDSGNSGAGPDDGATIDISSTVTENSGNKKPCCNN
eukprot:TRINITY_DN79_c0_g1_i9.p1 TRINITY_DN79_c0_g1~~TRINITY_DN79_c0_g1_i9.p1  ORF type:complete len:174 (-),score=1.84 TRINITY_DN79_c0_g1_i9:515-1036(-)